MANPGLSVIGHRSSLASNPFSLFGGGTNRGTETEFGLNVQVQNSVFVTQFFERGGTLTMSPHWVMFPTLNA
jgi:hypothetical protein